jgi:hypothetical protein
MVIPLLDVRAQSQARQSPPRALSGLNASK